MQYFLKPTIFGLVIVASLSACGEKEKTAAEAEVERNFKESVKETARNLAVINPKHDAQYYVDRMAELLSSCSKRGDIDLSCYKNGLSRLQTE